MGRANSSLKACLSRPSLWGAVVRGNLASASFRGASNPTLAQGKRGRSEEGRVISTGLGGCLAGRRDLRDRLVVPRTGRPVGRRYVCTPAGAGGLEFTEYSKPVFLDWWSGRVLAS